jgi:hypothetical protein
MKKLIDLLIRSKYLKRRPLHFMQFAYQAVNSSEIEIALGYKKVALMMLRGGCRIETERPRNSRMEHLGLEVGQEEEQIIIRTKRTSTVYQQGFEVIGCADDLVIIVRGKVDSVFLGQLQSASNYTTDWCKDSYLSVNPKKMIDAS